MTANISYKVRPNNGDRHKANMHVDHWEVGNTCVPFSRNRNLDTYLRNDDWASTKPIRQCHGSLMSSTRAIRQTRIRPPLVRIKPERLAPKESTSQKVDVITATRSLAVPRSSASWAHDEQGNESATGTKLAENIISLNCHHEIRNGDRSSHNSTANERSDTVFKQPLTPARKKTLYTLEPEGAKRYFQQLCAASTEQ